MGIRILVSKDGEEVLYDSVSMRAFGPVFDQDTMDYGLDEFLTWLQREYSVTNAKWFHDTDYLYFERAYSNWLREMKKEAA